METAGGATATSAELAELQRLQPAEANRLRVSRGSLVGVGALILVIFAAGVWSTFLVVGSQPVGLAGQAVALAAIGTVTFLGCYAQDHEVRTALAASMTLFFFALFSSAFNEKVSVALQGEPGKTQLGSVTTLLATIGAFYLAGKTVEKVAAISEQGLNISAGKS